MNLDWFGIKLNGAALLMIKLADLSVYFAIAATASTVIYNVIRIRQSLKTKNDVEKLKKGEHP